jgi:hypothetical protein
MQVLLRPIARRYFERINEPDKSHVKACLKDLGKEPPEGDMLPITGQTGCARLGAI